MLEKLKIHLIDRYIIRKFLGTFIFVMAIFIAIAIVFDISEKIDDFLKTNTPFKEILFDYYLNFIPYYIGLLSPLLIFIAAIFFTARMANNTEIVAILSGGVSFKRLLYPYFVASLVLAAVSFFFNAYFIPNANKTRVAFENKYVNKKFVYKERNIHMQLDDSSYAYMESYNNQDNIGYRFSLEKFNGKELRYKLLADQIRWDSTKKNWQISNFSIRYIDGLNESIQRGQAKDTILAMSPEDFERKDNSIASLTNPELREYISKEKKRGNQGFEAYEIEYYKRYAMPFATFILVLIAVSLCSRKVRGGIGAQLGIGIGSSFAFIMLMQFTTTFAIKGGLHPIVSVWIPNLVFTVYGLYLLKIAPK